MQKPWVIKIGGRLCEEPALRSKLAQACLALGKPVVIVHGGGAQVTELQGKLGMSPTFVQGRRVTAPEEVVAVEMALSGAVNKALVRSLLDLGGKAVGLSAVDAGMVRCTLVSELGAVGLPAQVDTSLIELLLGRGYIVALSPVSLGPSGEPLNVNADELACALAGALQAEKLLLVSDVEGVLQEGAALAEVKSSDVETLIEQGVAKGGMVPKLRAAARAVTSGVGAVHITGFVGDFSQPSGTRVSGPRAPGAMQEVAHG